MRTIADLYQTLSKVDFKQEVEIAFIDSSKTFVQLQKDQLLSGERSDGEAIFNLKTGSDEYSPSYAKKKGKKKPIDLRNKNDFYSGIFVDPRADGLVSDSADSKSEMLQETYGKEIFGLNEERQPKYGRAAADSLIKNYRTKLKI